MASTGSPPPTRQCPTSRHSPAPVPGSRSARAATSSGSSTQVPACGWNATRTPSGAAAASSCSSSASASNAASGQRGAPSATRPAHRSRCPPAVDGDDEHLAATGDEPAKVASGDVGRSRREAILVRVERGVELGEAQAAPRERLAQHVALGKAAAVLRAGEPEPRDLVEDRLRRRLGREVGQVGVVPDDRHAADRGR